MMESMTGFGSGTAEASSGVVRVQIASVNHRGARVSVRSDIRDLELEERIRQRVSAALVRGSISVHIGFRPSTSLAVDPEALAATWRELAALAQEIGAPIPGLDVAARLQVADAQAGADTLGTVVAAAVDEAIDACRAMRLQEGVALAAAFADQIAALRAVLPQIAEIAGRRVQGYHARLAERLADLLRDQAECDAGDLVREMAVYADRIDITEEQVRLASHLDQLEAAMGTDGPCGKRIEFLLQECGREVNTTGSKANDAELQALVVDAKTLLEQMREQAANVV